MSEEFIERLQNVLLVFAGFGSLVGGFLFSRQGQLMPDASEDKPEDIRVLIYAQEIKELREQIAAVQLQYELDKLEREIRDELSQQVS